MADKILVVGSANADLVINSPKMPKLGETLTGSNFRVNAGGKGLNQAVAIAKLGGDVTFLGCVGEDANGSVLLDALDENGVTFKGGKVTDTPTGIAMITVVEGNNFIVLSAGANDKLTPDIVQAQAPLIMESDYCVMQLEIPLESVIRVCDIAKDSGTAVVLNPAPYRELPEELLRNVDYLIPNEHEANDLTGIYPNSEENCIKAIANLRDKGVKNVIITLGERGCVYNDGDEIIFRPAIETKVVDTTSAGDCFIGALVSRLSRGVNLSDAIDFATKASAIAVSREGASKSIPYENEIK